MPDESSTKLSPSANRIPAPAEIRGGVPAAGGLETPVTPTAEHAPQRNQAPEGTKARETDLEMEILSPCDANFHEADEAEDTPPGVWNWGLLAEMDWKRVHELVRALLHRSGVRMQILRSGQDGSRMALINRPGDSTKAAGSLVYLSGWPREKFSDQLAQRLLEEQMVEQAGKTVLIQPVIASLETHRIARANGIEIVDAARLLSMISSLPPDESHYLLELFTAGKYRHPSCPICLRSMQQRSRTEATQQGAFDRDFVPVKSGTMPADVICKHMLIGSQLQWRFAGRVRAESIHIQGRVHGDCVCLGKFRLGPKAEFHGSIIAQSVEVSDGGLLNGECSILSGPELRRRWEQVDTSMVWSCENFPQCRGMLELR